MKELLALAVAALFVSCGPRSAGNAASGTAPEEVRTPVEMAETIALVKPELKGGLTINEALQNRRSWREYAPEASRSRSCRVCCGLLRASTVLRTTI